MSTVVSREPGVAVARRAASELCDALGVPLLRPARVAAVGLLPPPLLLRAADGWVHPGPPTAWADFEAMVGSLGGDLTQLAAEAVDAEAGAWMLPAVAVRQRRLAGWDVQQENGQSFVAVDLVPERHFVRGNR